MESLQLRPIEKAKISCARKLFNEISTGNVVYHDVDSYQSLLNIMPQIKKTSSVKEFSVYKKPEGTVDYYLAAEQGKYTSSQITER